MRRIVWVAVAVLLAGCAIQPSGVTRGGEAPTGVAPGVTLYFVDAHGQLRPQLRRTGRLGTVSEALALLLSGPGTSGLRTEIAPSATPRTVVTTTPDTIRLMMPLTIDDVTELGIHQIVCTALGVHVQSGGSRNTKVRVRFTLPTPESGERRTCPLIG
ncbi:hypothetical protein [Streptomyces xinghaiensis]|uniref:hypothetical protein n=1 Tax=Streptomyces xinghaiensis TaxID=1038928 RepID=UPI0005852779|nr:hypothetical protein [Streptomyces xinghaiensis]MZE75949.1 hypothetical protein [Streptomyces sp. SID5475]